MVRARPIDEGLARARWKPRSLTGAYATAERVAAQDQNNLYRASCCFRDLDRYQAFCAFYAIMRILDDRVDGLPARAGLSRKRRTAEHNVVEAWRLAVRSCFEDAAGDSVEGAPPCPEAPHLLTAFRESHIRFPVPWRLWENFFSAMHRDIDRPRFCTYQAFLRYAEGASVAPTTIYLTLIAAADADPGLPRPLPQGFDLIRCGRHLGRFAYLGHMLRDLAQDLFAVPERQLYLAADDMAAFGVSEQKLASEAAARRAGPRTRALVGELVRRARAELARGRARMHALEGRLESDRAFVLEFIVTLYERILDKIQRCGNDPFTGLHHLTPSEKTAIGRRIANDLRIAGTT